MATAGISGGSRGNWERGGALAGLTAGAKLTMAKEIGRRFEAAAGAVVVTLEDALGARSVHTIHVLRPDGSEEDVEGVVAKAIAEAGARAEKVAAAFRKAGWKG